MNENKKPVTISVSPDLLRRIDAVADARGENRSQMIERMLTTDIADEESFVTDMEDPIKRTVARAIVASPMLLSMIAGVVGEGLGEEDLARIRRNAPKQVARGKARATAKKRSPRSKEAMR